MLKKILVFVLMIAGAGLVSCSKDYCGELAKQACKKAPDTKACQQAKTLTNKTTCKAFLANVDKYIKETNLKVTSPPLKPPATPKKVAQKPAKTEKAANTADKTKVHDAAAANTAKDVAKSANAPAAKAAAPAKNAKDANNSPKAGKAAKAAPSAPKTKAAPNKKSK